MSFGTIWPNRGVAFQNPYSHGDTKRVVDLPCDFCMLRHARHFVGDESACTECADSRTARIEARHRLMLRAEMERVREQEPAEVMAE